MFRKTNIITQILVYQESKAYFIFQKVQDFNLISKKNYFHICFFDISLFYIILIFLVVLFFFTNKIVLDHEFRSIKSIKSKAANSS